MVSAEFTDIFGVIGFVILLYIGVSLKKNKKVKSWISSTIITIASIGLLVDLYIVFKTYVFG